MDIVPLVHLLFRAPNFNPSGISDLSPVLRLTLLILFIVTINLSPRENEIPLKNEERKKEESWGRERQADRWLE